MRTVLLDASRPANIRRAASCLRRGGLVAFPTETVYGLGADAFNTDAVCRVFEAKKRPSFDPLIVHIADLSQWRQVCPEIPASAIRLAREFWPGPLSIVLPKSKRVPDLVTSGLPAVAVRMPDHPAALALIRSLGRPVAAPSANLFGRISPTDARHVLEDLEGKVDIVLDGGRCRVGVESTVLKLDGGRATILRPGGIAASRVRGLIQTRISRRAGASFESPGLLKSHYAPKSPMVLLKQPIRKVLPALLKLSASARSGGRKPPRWASLCFRRPSGSKIFVAERSLSRSGDLHEAAASLFQAMRELDKIRPDLILAEPVPARGIGEAIIDRLKKASASRTDLLRTPRD